MKKNTFRNVGFGIFATVYSLANVGCSDSIDDAITLKNGEKILFEDGNDGWRIPLISAGIDYVAEAVFDVGGKPGTFGEGDAIIKYNSNGQKCMTIEDNDENGTINKRDDDAVIFHNGDKEIFYGVDKIIDHYGDTHYPDDKGADILFKHRDKVFANANKIFPSLKRDFLDQKANENSNHYKNLLKEMQDFEKTGPCSPNYNP